MPFDLAHRHQGRRQRKRRLVRSSACEEVPHAVGKDRQWQVHVFQARPQRGKAWLSWVPHKIRRHQIRRQGGLVPKMKT